MSTGTIYVVYQMHPRETNARPAVAARDAGLALCYARALAEARRDQSRYGVAEVPVTETEPEQIERWVANAVVYHDTRAMDEVDTRRYRVWSYEHPVPDHAVPGAALGRHLRGADHSVLTATGATEQEALESLNRLYDDLCLHLSLETAGRG